jgi:uncharacterized membrane protein
MMLPSWGIDLGATPLLIVGLLVFGALLIVTLIHASIDDAKTPGTHLPTPRDTLDEHLTKGEITREEYIDRRKGLDFIVAMV